MRFLSLNDPADIARALAAMEAAWNEVKRFIPDAQLEAERVRLASLVAGFAPLALDEEDLTQNALHHFKQRAETASADASFRIGD